MNLWRNLYAETRSGCRSQGARLSFEPRHRKFLGAHRPAGLRFHRREPAHHRRARRKLRRRQGGVPSRLTAEIVGIPFDQIDAACDFAAARGLYFGGTGAKIRPITACKGTTCVYGNYDTQALAKTLHEKYYVGWAGVKLPHKFKIGVGGCPNSCMKPALNDFGIEGRRAPDFHAEDCRGCKVCVVETRCPSKAAHVVDGKLAIGESCLQCGVCTGKCPFKAVRHESETRYRIYVGGTWGKQTRMGSPLSRLVAFEEIEPLLEKTMLWFKENAFEKERLGKAIDRIGFDRFEAALLSDDLLARKAEILAQPVKMRA